jgi:hypothetical protein
VLFGTNNKFLRGSPLELKERVRAVEAVVVFRSIDEHFGNEKEKPVFVGPNTFQAKSQTGRLSLHDCYSGLGVGYFNNTSLKQ